jgi:hypothetical protein
VQIKKVLKVVLLCCLIGILAVSAFGCSKAVDNKYNLPNQMKPNYIYYFEQGYHEGWKLVGDPDGRYSIPEEKLVIEIQDEAAPDVARYCVYKQREHQDMPMTSTLQTMFALTTNPDHDLYFNKNMGVRDDYKVTSAEPISLIVNGNQYYSATYTFAKEGKAWQGQYFLLPHSRQFYVIAFEAQADKWAEYEPKFKEMMNDFKPLGFETEQGIS